MALANLVVNLTAKTHIFDRAMRRSQTTLRGFTQQVANNTNRMIGWGRALMAMAGIAGVGYLIKRTMDSIDATAKLSDRINIATEDLIALQHAADLSGISIKELGTGIQYLSRNIGQRAKILEQLGLSANAMAQRDMMSNLKLVADRLSALPTVAERAAAAFQLFGRGGMPLLTLLAEGSRGLSDMQRDAERLGITFSRLDASKVEYANDAMTRLRAAMRGVAQQFVIGMSPGIAAMADTLTDYMAAHPEWARNAADLAEKMTLGMARLVGAIHDWIGTVKPRLGLMSAFARGGPTAMMQAYGQQLWGRISPYNKTANVSPEAEITSWFEKYRTRLSAIETSLGQRAGGMGGGMALSGDGAATGDIIKKEMDALRGITQGIDKQVRVMQVMQDTIGMSKELAELQLAAEEAFGERSEAAAQIVETYAKKLELLNAVEQRAQLLEQAKQQHEQWQQNKAMRGELAFASPQEIWREVALAVNRQGDTLRKEQLLEQRRTTDAIRNVDSTIQRLLPYAGTVGP